MEGHVASPAGRWSSHAASSAPNSPARALTRTRRRGDTSALAEPVEMPIPGSGLMVLFRMLRNRGFRTSLPRQERAVFDCLVHLYAR